MSQPHPVTLSEDWRIRERWLVVALAVAGALAFGASYVLPWWNFHMVSPQYPRGLDLIVSLTGVTGDTAEINTINHYIGMGHLDDAATLERAYAGWLIAALGVFILTLILGAGRRLGWTAGSVAAALPLGFLADTWYWLYRFGHDLDPRAPVHIPPFTPNLFGAGKVGQFHTVATPSLGFFVAALGVALVAVAVWRRAHVCRVCPARHTCGRVCPNGLVGVRS